MKLRALTLIALISLAGCGKDQDQNQVKVQDSVNFKFDPIATSALQIDGLAPFCKTSFFMFTKEGSDLVRNDKDKSEFERIGAMPIDSLTPLVIKVSKDTFSVDGGGSVPRSENVNLGALMYGKPQGNPDNIAIDNDVLAITTAPTQQGFCAYIFKKN